MQNIAIHLLFLLGLPGILSSQGYWFQQVTPAGTPDLYDIQFVTKNKGWCVGNTGTILHTTNGGTLWISQNSAVSADLKGAWFLNEQTGYVCGTSGTLLKTTNGGGTWIKPIASLTSAQLNDVFFQDANIGWVVGESGSVFRTNDGGTTWTAETPNSSYDYLAVKKTPALPGGTLFVTGKSAVVYKTKTDGPPWTNVSMTSHSNPLTDLVFFDSLNGLVCGDDSVYKTTDGGVTWLPFSTGAGGQLEALTMAGFLHGWTILSGSIIPYTDDGGSSWTIQNSPVTVSMYGICSYTNSTAWACGQDGKIIKYSTQAPEIATITTLDFGNLLCETERTRVFYVKNKGSGVLDIYSADIGGIDKFEFILSGPTSFPLSIQPNDSVAFTIRWKPFAIGGKSAYIELSHNDVPRNPTVVQFMGTKDSTEIDLSVTQLNLPQTCVGEPIEASLEVLARGTETVLIEEVTKISGSDEIVMYSPSLPVSIAAGGKIALSFRYLPSSPGAATAEFRVRTTPCDRERTFVVNATAIQTIIASIPDPVNFGTVTVGNTVNVTLVLTNPGATQAQVTDLALQPPQPALSLENVPPLPFRINPGEQKNILLTFTPTDTVTLASRLCLEWDRVCSGTKCISINGKSEVQPRIIVPPILVFDPLVCDYTITDTVELRNTGSGPLRITEIVISGKDAANFKVLEPLAPVVVDTGMGIDVVVQFTATDAGDKGAIIRMRHNDVLNDPTDILIGGRKDIVAFSVTGDTTAPVRVCTGFSESRFFSIINTGSIALRVLDIINQNGSAPFILRGIVTPVMIEPGGSQVFEVVFRPAVSGSFSTAFTVITDKCGAQHTVGVTGIGLKTEFTPSRPIDFGDVKIGGSVIENISVKNTGNLKGEVSALFIEPPVPGLSLETPPPVPFTLDTGQSRVFRIRFAPVTEGTFSTYLYFVILQDCIDTIRIPISAASTSSELTVSRTHIDLSASPCRAEEKCDTLTLKNYGTAPIIVRDIRINQRGSTFSLFGRPSFPFSLDSGYTLKLTVCADLHSAKKDSGQLHIESSDTKRPLLEILLRAARDSIGVNTSQSWVNYGILAPCEPFLEKGFRVVNTGSLPDTLRFMPPADSAFSLVGSVVRVLPPGGADSVVVRFVPAPGRYHEDTLGVLSSYCGNYSPVTLTGERDSASLRVVTPNLQFGSVSLGSGIVKDASVENRGKDNVLIDTILILPDSEGFSLSGTYMKNVDTAGVVSVSLSFTPTEARNHQAAAFVITSKPCRDTLRIELHGTGVRNALTISRTNISYGDAAQCQKILDSVICTNSGIDTVTVVGVNISGVQGNAFRIQNPPSASEPIPPGQSKTYLILFEPLLVQDGPVNATFHLETAEGQRVDVTLQGTRITQMLPVLSSIDFGTVEIGNPQTKTILLTNPGTAVYCVRSAVSSHIAFSAAASFPLCLKPGEQVSMDVTFAPLNTSALADSLIFHIDSTCTDSIRLRLTGVGRRGLVIQTPLLSYGIVPRCKTSDDSVSVINNSGEVLTYAGAVVAGLDASLFNVVQEPSVPHSINPGDSILLVVRFDPTQVQDGTKNAELLTTFFTTTNDTIKQRTRIDGESANPELSIVGAAFSATVIGKSTAEMVLIRNTGRVPSLLDRINVTDTTFSITQVNPAPPVMLMPGDTVLLSVLFTPREVKDYISVMDIEADEPCRLREQLILQAEGIRGEAIRTGIEIKTVHGKPDQIIDIPLTIDTDLGTAVVTAYSGEVRFNRTMLYPIDVVRQGTLSEDMYFQFHYDHSLGIVTVEASGEPVRRGTGVLFKLRCKVLLGNDVETILELTPVWTVVQGNAVIERRTNGLFQLEGYCRMGDRLLLVDGTSMLYQNHPNPFGTASPSRELTTTITYDIGIEGPVSLVLYDALGRRVATPVEEWKKPGRYSISITGSDWQGGLYFCVMKSNRFTSAIKVLFLR